MKVQEAINALARRVALFCLGAFCMLACGCAARFQSHVVSVEVAPKVTNGPASPPLRVPALLRRVDTRRDGVSVSAQRTVIDGFLRTLRESGLFESVWLAQPDSESGTVTTVDVQFNQHESQHIIANTLKAGIVGGSFFLLSPVMPFCMDMESEMTVTFEGASGHTRSVAVKSWGAARFPMFYTKALALEGMRGQVLQQELKELGSQLRQFHPPFP